MIQESQTLPAGTIIQGTNGTRYVIEALLGTGGFSAVYRIQERRTRRVFALKELIDAYDRDRRPLLIEAELLKRLSHPALPRVYQVFENVKQNRVYLLMDYIEGKNLEVLRRERPEKRLPLTITLALLAPIMDALCYLHGQPLPVVHRDIKPANIIVPLGNGKPQLVDFGLAKEHSEDKTTTMFRYGTPGYAAPEQYGQGTNPRTDIYGLGATFYTLLTGVLPADALARSLDKTPVDPLRPANEICPALPEAVALVLDRAMRLRHEERFASVEEFWRELEAAVSQYMSEQVPPIPVTFVPDPVTPVPDPVIPAPTTNPAIAAVTDPATPSTSQQLAQPAPVMQASLRVLPQRSPIIPWLVIILVVVLLAALGGGSLFFYGILPFHQPRPVKTPHAVVLSSPQAPRATLVGTATPTAACSPADAGPLNPEATTPYPPLETCYMGTIYDSVANHKTALSLTNIRQDHQTITGDFWGLGYIGKFTGTVTTDGTVAFQVVLQKLSVTLSFQGTIKLGGDIAGNFDTLSNDTTQNQGESGSWYLCTPRNTTCFDE